MTQKTGASRRLIRPLLMLSLATLILIPVQAQDETGLDRYVNKPDPSFEWQMVKSYPGLGYGVFNIRMTSQEWLDRTKVEPNFWRHWLRVIIPNQVRRTTAVLLVTGGIRDEPDPGTEDTLALGLAAAATGTIIAELRAVPNQPLTTTEDGQQRSEDNLLAYSWNKFLFTGNEEWVAHSAMTKAVVRGMDAISELCSEPVPCNGAITEFIVGGASKRGWASWLAAAADFDKRVVAIAPVVIDILNVQPSLVHHYQAYGDWSPAIADYVEFGIPAWIGSKQMQELLTIADPYTYLNRLTMPKYIINSTGDEFFPPDSSRFYFDHLQGENYLRYIPNTSHSLDDGEETVMAALAWADALLSGTQLPRFTWKFENDGRIAVTAQDEPAEVKLWQATNPAARDFRLDTIGKAWSATTVESSGEGVYVGAVPAPARGWRAYFLELAYTDGFSVPLKFTTAVRIIPDTLPFGPPLVSVHAASYDPLSAPDSIGTVFGAGLTDRVEVATTIPLPTELAGIRLRLIDANDVPHWAELFYAGPNQINYRVPEFIALGLTRIEVVRNAQVLVWGQSNIVDVAPGLFSANANGEGVAAGSRLRIKIDGQRDGGPLAALNSEGTAYEEVPFALGVNTNQTFLVLFGSGMRRAKEIHATIDGVEVETTNPIPSQEFISLDQVNLGPLPTTLANRGVVEIVLELDGQKTNPVTIRIL